MSREKISSKMIKVKRLFSLSIDNLLFQDDNKTISGSVLLSSCNNELSIDEEKSRFTFILNSSSKVNFFKNIAFCLFLQIDI